MSMNAELQQAFEVIREQGAQIHHLAQLLEAQMAMRESQNTILQSLCLLLADRPELRTLLAQVHSLRELHHLRQAMSEDFIAAYQDHLKAMLPESLLAA
ncbi:hypothetical protein [Herbaspirillum huttiense]|uniref:hypothetical protein n=1 Tax=Herbaspirillum huttiense TaxID=863372 RepID=UPI0039AFD14F